MSRSARFLSETLGIVRLVLVSSSFILSSPVEFRFLFLLLLSWFSKSRNSISLISSLQEGSFTEFGGSERSAVGMFVWAQSAWSVSKPSRIIREVVVHSQDEDSSWTLKRTPVVHSAAAAGAEAPRGSVPPTEDGCGEDAAHDGCAADTRKTNLMQHSCNESKRAIFILRVNHNLTN